VVAGTPAVHKKYRFAPALCEALQEIKWWQYELGDFYRFGFDFSDPASFVDRFERYQYQLQTFKPRIFQPEHYT